MITENEPHESNVDAEIRRDGIDNRNPQVSMARTYRGRYVGGGGGWEGWRRGDEGRW